jgi:hypothetical protein
MKLDPAQYDEVVPNAPALVGSLRASGYDLESAVADVIDNSISAGAREVWITINDESEHSWIAIRDDGCGMTADGLTLAMTLGGLSPDRPRAASDLGRFGLGLKTASFSQCRRLTVLTRMRGATVSVRCWDIDVVNRTGRWTLLRSGPNKPLEHRFIAQLQAQEHGTVVLWENLDRIIHDAVGREASERLLSRVPKLEEHLGLTFHRFIKDPGRLVIRLGQQPIPPADPFLETQPACQLLGEEELACRGHLVRVCAFVLPHVTKLNAQSLGIATTRDWTAKQGFYVYRNERLLVGATWLQLGLMKEEDHKLARIRIDFSNDLDFAWDINIRKSRAVPPDELRPDLLRIAKRARQASRAAYRHRGAVLARALPGKTFLWNRLVARGGISYRINRDHPVIAALLDAAGPRSPLLQAIKGALRLIEETVPVPTIISDISEHHDALANPIEDDMGGEAEGLFRLGYEMLRKNGLDPKHAFEQLATAEPFVRYPHLLAAFREKEHIGE